VTTVGDEVVGFGAEGGDEFDGGGGLEEMFGPAQQCGDERGVGR
jgi:hypothetical protein